MYHDHVGRMLSSKALLPRATADVKPQRPALQARNTIRLATPQPANLPITRDEAKVGNPMRRIAFYALLGFLFLRLSDLSNLLLYYTGASTYLLYLFAPVSILGMLITGGIPRTFRHKASKFWVAFFVWMVLATPFSFWRGNSLALVLAYTRVQLPMVFVMAGLAITWSEIRLIFYTVAASALGNLATARFLTTRDEGGRITLEASASIGNSNDLGALLLLVLPFLLFVVLDRARNAFLRVSLVPLILYGVWVVLGTASRGCLIALAAMFLFALWRATSRQRMTIALAAVMLAAVAPALLPGSVLSRLSSLFGEKNNETRDADESSAQRQYLLKQSLLYTIQHPVFGVGPGQFPNYEGGQQAREGKRGAWKVTHNFLTQISSECGIPALFFVLASLGSAMALVHRTYRQAKQRHFREIVNACFCYQMALIGYLGSVIFLAQAYHFYLPMMVGLAIGLSYAAQRHMSATKAPLGQQEANSLT